ncbi:MAG: class I SAM-dependent methyltransferase [Candidatus Hydrogenedentes bacterium]|nr:class I SAM-dependent methyltransferase [Candidatus Hydrogenedentota bacterium]
MIQRFIQWNKSCCRRIEGFLPNARENTFDNYPRVIQAYLAEANPRIVLDVGGGKTCAYREDTRPHAEKVFALDISVDELQYNRVVDDRLVTDITKALPFADASVDLITSRSVLEHLSNLEAFVAEAQRVLRPGGLFIHLVPNRFAPFALINQALPNRLSKRIVHYLHPSTQGICGFPAVYDHCWPSAMERLLEKHDFQPILLRPAYYQSKYFSFFVPFYLGSNLYELTTQSLRLRNLCAHFLLVARRRQ